MKNETEKNLIYLKHKNISFYVIGQGSLTIVRRSNSRKENLLNLQQPPTTENSPSSEPSSSSSYRFETETTERFNFVGNFDNMQSSSSSQMHTATGTAVATVADATVVASPNNVVDLATDNLPAVDTPDACDKAALR